MAMPTARQNSNEQQTWTKYERRWKAMQKPIGLDTRPRGHGVMVYGRTWMHRTRIFIGMSDNMGRCFLQVPERGSTLRRVQTQECRGRRECRSCSQVRDLRLGRIRIGSGTR